MRNDKILNIVYSLGSTTEVKGDDVDFPKKARGGSGIVRLCILPGFSIPVLPSVGTNFLSQAGSAPLQSQGQTIVLNEKYLMRTKCTLWYLVLTVFCFASTFEPVSSYNIWIDLVSHSYKLSPPCLLTCEWKPVFIYLTLNRKEPDLEVSSSWIKKFTFVVPWYPLSILTNYC